VEAGENLPQLVFKTTRHHIAQHLLLLGLAVAASVRDKNKMADRPKGYGMTAELADKVRLLWSSSRVYLVLSPLHP